MPLEFLDGADAPSLDAPVVENVPADAITATPAEQPEGPARGPDGKFVSKAPAETAAEPVQAQSPEPAPQVAQQAPEPQHIPISAMLDERDKRQAAERRAQDLEQRLQQHERQQQPAQPEQVPDPYEDPQGFTAYMQNVNSQAILNARLDISEEMARGKHGDDVVNAARDWVLQQTPSVRAEILAQRNPYETAVQRHQQHTVLSGVKPDQLALFQQWLASQGAAPMTPAPAAQPAQAAPPSPPPRSLASVPSAAGAAHVPTGPGEGYASLPIG